MSEIWPHFVETLPLGLGTVVPVSTEPSDSPRRLPSILLLDDDPFMLGMLSRMLRSMGYPMIGTAASAEAALSILRSDPDAVDVIVCDLNMPGIDGIEFLQRLNTLAVKANVVLLSGEGTRIMHTVQKLLGDGHLVILGALEKPAGRTSLRALLDRWQPAASTPTAPEVSPFTEADLAAAIRHKQWVMHYQPMVDLRTGDLAGVEALVRWAHPVHGLIYPGDFVHKAEESGTIDALTDWVMQTALAQLSLWQADGMNIHVAVNISMKSLSSPGFVRHASAMARNAGVSPQDITLEVTEGHLISPDLAPLEGLVRLRLERFGVTLDDFGTGHSSLAQLRDVPFTELKIDRSFVRGARNNQIIRPILEGSIGIAKRLGMGSVAEGVQTEDDWHLLREIGCDVAQGWFIARPMRHDRMAQWVDEWESRRGRLVGT